MIKKKEKILVLTSSFPRWPDDDNSGGGKFVLNLSKGYLDKFKVFVLAPGFIGAKRKENIEGLNVRRFYQSPFKHISLAYGHGGILPALKKNKFLYFCIPIFLLNQLIALKKLIKAEKIKIIHAHWALPQGLVATFYKRIFNPKLKILLTINGSDFWGFDNLFSNKIKKFVFKNSDIITVPNLDVKLGISKMGVKGDIHVMPMGVDTSFFTNKKKDLHLKSKLKIKGPFLLFVGALVENKGIKHLLRALKKILLRHPSTTLVVIGKGALEDELKAFVESNNIFKNVRFLNKYIPYEDLPKYFATCDICILPSLSEGFPITFMEAISSGTYTVVTEIPVFKTLLKDHKISFMVKPNSDKGIYEKVIEILDNLKEYAPLKEKAREYVVQNHDWVAVQKKYKNTLIRLL
ncbi:glycosyltransferase family 4 protein [bacterium]|nr:glycosyltransferase family 4 protein [bacterium]